MAGFILLGIVSCSDDEAVNSDQELTKATFEKTYEAETEKNLKNPYMGWTLYSNGLLKEDNAGTYWALQEEAAERYAGLFHIRWKWSSFEAEEGNYAWETDDNFKALVQGAIDKGLRLSFRVTVNGRDSNSPAVPQYVLDGSECYTELPNNQNPYADDSFFLEKYTKFIKAFGEKFNDPAIVDYVDCTGLGWWGEEHHVTYKNPSNRLSTMRTIMEAYTQAFDRVIVVSNFERAADEKQLAFTDLNLSPRRDGYVSQHFGTTAQKEFVSHFPNKPLIAEACYNAASGDISKQENGKWATWKIYYTELVDLALETHANYLDLRTVAESQIFLSDARDQVKRFVEKGGYRIYPEKVTGKIENGKITINHSWKNIGVGVLPNNNMALDYKYKVAFALFNDQKEIVKSWTSDQVEVSKLVGDNAISATDEFDLGDISQGKYSLAVGIINQRENDSKDITLAVKFPKLLQGEWVFASELDL